MFTHWTIILSYLLAFGQRKIKAQRERRSTEFPSLKEIADATPETVKIQSSECSFNSNNDDCLRHYASEGICAFSQVLSQLVPDLSIEDATNNFIVPEKFQISGFDMSKCQDDNGIVTFKGKSLESVELVPQQLTLGAETELQISWNFLKPINPEALEVKLKGQTSIGGTAQVELEVRKPVDGSGYTLQFKIGTLNVNNFLAHFRVEASEVISSDLSFASSRMGLATLIMQDAKMTGLFSPGGGVEIVATGRITAPELPADASRFYIIIQDFQEGSSDSVDEGYGKPIAAIFAIFKERPRNAITSLTGIDIPNLAIFKGVSEVAITAATKQIFNINSKVLRDLVDKYVPLEGMDMISKGLTVMHYSLNGNEDVKDKDEKTASRILYRCQIESDTLTWTSPQRIETDVDRIGGSVWSLRGCADTIAIPSKTKAIFVDITYTRQESQMEVRFNLTERVPVLPKGLVSLLNSTIILYSKEKIENECSWKMNGTGRETILDELVDINITQTKHRTTVSAVAEIFDMQTLMNRTKAKPFNEQYEKAFPFIARCPLGDLRYEAVFFKGNVLRFKGFALVEGKPNVEIIYDVPIKGEPYLKMGFAFRGMELSKVVDIFYGEKKMSSTWIRFAEICIVVKEVLDVKSVSFDRGCMKTADKYLDTPGIGFVADQLILRNCKAEEWVMCKFLKMHGGKMLDFTYFGRMLPEKVTMKAQSNMRLELGNGILFKSNTFESHLSATKGGDRLVLKADVVLTDTNNVFPDSKIIDDGSHNIILWFRSINDSHRGRDPLNVHYARMMLIRSKFKIPAARKIDVIEFDSRLSIGTIESNMIQLRGDTSRQYISYPEGSSSPVVKFVGEKAELKLKNFYHAFGMQLRNDFLKNAIFPESVVFAYTSTDEEWIVPEFQVTVSKGLHIFGKLKLKTEDVYDTTVNLLDNMQIQTVVHLRPLRFGKVMKSKDGQVSFENVNLFLYGSKEQSDSGPKLVVDPQSQYLKGYAKTIGLEGAFMSEPWQNVRGKKLYTIKLKGNLYKEVKDAEVMLETEDKDRPDDYQFKYSVDITRQGKSNVNAKLREVLSDLESNAKKGRDTAYEMASDVSFLLESYKKQRQGYLNEVSSVQQQIHYINSDVDLAMIDITTDCINQCRTVFIPQIEWADDCLQSSGRQRNVKCMTWNEHKDKVINVICLLKCEAKKMAVAGEAAKMLDEIRMLVNRYRERKALSENIGKLIALVEQADEIAKSAKELVESKTNIQGEINELLAIPDEIVQLNTLKVDTDLEGIAPPCLPFQMEFTVNTKQPTNHEGVYRICFNGEFHKNVVLRVMKVKYPSVDEMYKALEEAELRYAQIGAIRKSLKVVEDEVHSSKRGQVPLPKEEDPVERMLSKIAKRRIPKFTLKGDRTVLAFHHYSPWATIKRSHPFEVEGEPSFQTKYNASRIHGKSPCHQTKEVIAQYKDIADNLQQLSKKYEHGKHLYRKSQSSISKDLRESLHDISKLRMGYYLDMFNKNLDKQSERSLYYLRNELASFYGMMNFVEHLGDISSKAVSRSKIHGARKRNQLQAISYVGKELENLLFGAVTLDNGSAAIQRVQGEIEKLYHSAASCY